MTRDYEGIASMLQMSYAAGKRECQERSWHADARDDYANRVLAIAAQEDQDERYEDAAVEAHEARYETWLSLEGNEP